jgi:hypothetical protein
MTFTSEFCPASKMLLAKSFRSEPGRLLLAGCQKEIVAIPLRRFVSMLPFVADV